MVTYPQILARSLLPIPSSPLPRGTAGSWIHPCIPSRLGLTSGFVQSIAVTGTLHRDLFSACKQGFLTWIRRLSSALLTVMETEAEQRKHVFL